MSTDHTQTSTLTSPTREKRRFEARIDDPIQVVIAGRIVDATLRDVDISHHSIRTTLTLYIETAAGDLRVSPDAVIE